MNDLSEITILIVEDEGLIALEMMEFLANEGYRVLDPVPTGEEAVERCGDYPRPDLILMDIHLDGEIDGIEATRRIREQYPIPVLIITACDDGLTGSSMKDLAPDGYLVKPATRKDIIAAISLALQSDSRKGSGETGDEHAGDLRGQTDQ